jgi:ribosomal protein S18 acetylase RimI-like enzyme
MTPITSQARTTLTILDPTKHTHLLHEFVAIHHACIIQDFTQPTFLPPLQPEMTLRWWQARVDEVIEGTRTIVFATPSSLNGQDARGEVVAGVVMLSKPPSETGPFRGVVEKLLVSPIFRRRGVARALMMKLEEAGREAGRTLLVSFTFKSNLF